MGREDYARYAKSWSAPDYTVDENGKVVAGHSDRLGHAGSLRRGPEDRGQPRRLPLGEFWVLDELAADCAADGRYEFMLVAPPLNIPGAVGSPLNPIAIK